MRRFYQFGMQKNLIYSLQCCCCCYISIFQLRTIAGFTGQAGSTCLDTDKQDLKYSYLKHQIMEASCKNRAGSLLDGSGYCASKIAQLSVQVFSRFFKLMTAIILMLHAEH